MTRRERRVFRIIVGIGLFLVLAFAVWWYQLSHIPNNFHGAFHIADYFIFFLLSYVVWQPILMELFTWLATRKIHKPPQIEPQPGLKVAFITTYVPSAEPSALLHNILPAMKAADYKHDVWLLDEGNNAEAKDICKQYKVKYFSRKELERYNTDGGKFATKTKGGNHNAWYDYIGHTYDIVAQIDTDFVPQYDFLTKTLGYFRDPTVAFVGTPQVYGNGHKSWIAKGASEQTYGFYGPILRGLFGHQMTLMIGANHVVRVKALRHIGYYAAHITEDLLTGMKLHAKWYRSVYVPEQLAIGEGPATWTAYFNQQMRWSYGCIDIFFRHSRKLIGPMRRKHGLNYYLLQQHYFSGLAMAVGIVLLSLYFMFGITPTAMSLAPLLMIYLPVIIWQFFIQRWLQRFYINPDTEKGLNLRGMLVGVAAWPIYFLALVGVIIGKRLTFKVTPKGQPLPQHGPLKVFIPHIVIGSITLLDLALSFYTHHDSVVMIFWAIVTTVLMYGIAVNEFALVFSKLIWNTLLRLLSMFRLHTAKPSTSLEIE